NRPLISVPQLAHESKVPASPHLSCVGDSKDVLLYLVAQSKDAGIKLSVSLRCDLPSGMGMASGALRHANDLVSFIRQESGSHFHIEVAAYPVMHPQARTCEDALKPFVKQANAGAGRANPPYRVNADSHFHFADGGGTMGGRP
ncbi:methylenetetrahydrofolate reductase [NAD(P)H], partial [Pseudomonas syringae]